jgi:acyl-CoA synthetase (AMP-forming)/AMP-acid ligase II
MTSTVEPAAERETGRAGYGSEVDINAAAAVHRNARYQPDSIVIRYAGVDLTYTQLDGRAARLASVLADGGLAEVDQVAYVGLNSPSFLIAMLAAFRLGAIFVPVNFRLATPELHNVLTRSGASAVVCEEGHRTAVDAAREGTALERFLRGRSGRCRRSRGSWGICGMRVGRCGTSSGRCATVIRRTWSGSGGAGTARGVGDFAGAGA